MTGAARQLLDRARTRRGVLGFGGAPLGNFAGPMDDHQAARTLERAFAAGIRYVDTAPHYGLGLSERRIGDALRGRDRDEVVVSTKIGRLLVPNPCPSPQDTEGFAVPGDLVRRWDFSAEGARRSLEQSLSRLGLDTVDIVYVHDPDQAWDGAAREGLAALAPLKAAGLVQAVGIGTNSTAGLGGIIADGLVDVVMLANRYSLLDHSGLDEVLTPALRAGVPVVAAGVFGTGLLATPQPVPGATYEYRAAEPAVIGRARRIASVCADHRVALPAAALAFPLLHPAVGAIVVGMRSPREVDDDLRHFECEIPAQLWSDLVAEGLLPAKSVPSPDPPG